MDEYEEELKYDDCGMKEYLELYGKEKEWKDDDNNIKIYFESSHLSFFVDNVEEFIINLQKCKQKFYIFGTTNKVQAMVCVENILYILVK